MPRLHPPHNNLLGSGANEPRSAAIFLARFRLPRSGDVAFAQAIKTHRVVAEHFTFEFVSQVFARFQVRQVAAELVPRWAGGSR